MLQKRPFRVKSDARSRGNKVRVDGKVLHATFDAPPLNVIGPEMARDLIKLIVHLDAHEDETRVVVFDSSAPDYFSAHIDIMQLEALNEEVAKFEPGFTVPALFHRISALKQVTIAVVAGRVRGAASEFVLQCDKCFASLERAIFGQPEVGFGAIPGGGASQLSPG